MDPNQWGKYLWKSIHLIALGYPEVPNDVDKNVYSNYYTSLWKILPCFKCSINYKRHLIELPIESYLDSKKSLFEWTVKLHNIVNKELGKPEFTVAEAMHVINTGLDIDKPTKDWKIAIIVILCIVILLMLFRKRMFK